NPAGKSTIAAISRVAGPIQGSAATLPWSRPLGRRAMATSSDALGTDEVVLRAALCLVGDLVEYVGGIGALADRADLLLHRALRRGPCRVGTRVELGRRKSLDERFQCRVGRQLLAGGL